MMSGISAASRSSMSSASTRSRCRKMATSAPPLDQSRFTLIPSTSSREAIGWGWKISYILTWQLVIYTINYVLVEYIFIIRWSQLLVQKDAALPRLEAFHCNFFSNAKMQPFQEYFPVMFSYSVTIILFLLDDRSQLWVSFFLAK